MDVLFRIWFRDESFITSWGGGGYIQGWGSEMFLVMYRGIENEMIYGQGVMYFVRYGGGGSLVFHWSFFSLKVIASVGLCPSDPPISQLYNVILSEPLGRHWKSNMPYSC